MTTIHTDYLLVLINKLKLYVKLNEVELNDNLLQLGDTKTSEFLNVEKKNLDILTELSDGQIFEVSIRLDENKDFYKRTVFSLIDLLGILGGVYQVLFTLSSFFIRFISTDMLFYSILRRLYFTNKNNISQFNYANTNLEKRNRKIEEF